jgi:hypothetical protein
VKVPPSIIVDPSFTLLPSRIDKQTLPLFCRKRSLLEFRRLSKIKIKLEMEIKKFVLEDDDYVNNQVTLRRYPKQCGQNPPLVSET